MESILTSQTKEACGPKEIIMSVFSVYLVWADGSENFLGFIHTDNQYKAEKIWADLLTVPGSSIVIR